MQKDQSYLDLIVVDVKLKFTRSEIENHLVSLGYELQPYEHSVWVSDGPYDTCGETVTQTYQCAVVPGDAPGLHNRYMDVFESRINQKLKKLLLQ